MSFKAESEASESASTEKFSSITNTSRIIDLNDGDFKVGAEVWPQVSAVLGKTKSSDDHVTFEKNNKMAVYEVRGTTLIYSVKLVGIIDQSDKTLPNFPSSIPVEQVPYINWSLAIDVPHVWTCTPVSTEEVVTICNWAKSEGYTVRPKGIAHNWSPLTIPKDLAPDAKVILLDTSKLNSMCMIDATSDQPAMVRTGTGATMSELLSFLENQKGNGPAPGFSFANTPAPDHLSVGGVLAINGHGTSVSTPPNDAFQIGYGSMSNNIIELTAVVTDPDSNSPDEYQLKTFKRGEKDTKSMLTHLGRVFVVEVVLQVIDNYNMLCESFTDVSAETLFVPQQGANIPPKSLADYLAKSGRVEVIWFPFTDFPWLKVWTAVADQPEGSRKVDQPNNYPFSDNLPDWITDMAKWVTTTIPSMTPTFGKSMFSITDLGLNVDNARNLWGPSKNTLFYVKDSTLRVTANGYAILMKKEEVQNAVSAFAKQFEKMLKSYEAEGKYPINSPLEIRITGLDSGDSVHAASANPPLMSSLSTDAETEKNAWDVALWLDVLTLPDTKHSGEFYEELEQWFLDNFNGTKARVVPEWSKGWAYSKADGPWSNAKFIEGIRETYMGSRSDDNNWNFQVATLAKYDKFKLYENPLLNKLFVPVNPS